MDIILIIHVLSIVLWIGGVAFATMIIFPTIQHMEDPLARIQTFLGIERRFSRFAKVYVVGAGLTGILLFFRWGGFQGFGGLYLFMVGFKFFVWLSFFVLLFGAEKRLMNLLVSQQTAPEKAMRRLTIFHWFMLVLSGVAITFGVSLP